MIFSKFKKSTDEYSDVYGELTECISCHDEHSVEKSEDGDCYFCNNCHMIFSAEDYENWLNGGTITFDYENGDYFCDSSIYAPVYDENGNEVYTDCCRVPMKWDDSDYICPECGQRIDRRTFFNSIGANLPGDLCYTCDQLYPCTSCHLGYEIDEF